MDAPDLVREQLHLATIRDLRATLAEVTKGRDEAKKEYGKNIDRLVRETDELRHARKYAVTRSEAANARASALEERVKGLETALQEACEQILDSYRTWVADDIAAHPRPGQIPRYDRARALLRAMQEERTPEADR